MQEYAQLLNFWLGIATKNALTPVITLTRKFLRSGATGSDPELVAGISMESLSKTNADLMFDRMLSS